MDAKPGPAASPPYAVAQSAPHRILVCKACKPDFSVLKKLRSAIDQASLGGDFEVSGTASPAGCVFGHAQPCIVGYRATRKATWLFGDIDPNPPLDDLVAFNQTYSALDDGWRNGRDLPGRLCDTIFARISAAMIVTRERAIQ
jgi:predicted metal-binding protein